MVRWEEEAWVLASLATVVGGQMMLDVIMYASTHFTRVIQIFRILFDLARNAKESRKVDVQCCARTLSTVAEWGLEFACIFSAGQAGW